MSARMEKPPSAVSVQSLKECSSTESRGPDREARTIDRPSSARSTSMIGFRPHACPRPSAEGPPFPRRGLRRYCSAVKKSDGSESLGGEALRKEVCRRIRLARSYWDDHRNPACRRERARALQLYDTLTKAEKEKIPQVLRVWLRYRSEKYFNDKRTPPGGGKRRGIP